MASSPIIIRSDGCCEFATTEVAVSPCMEKEPMMAAIDAIMSTEDPRRTEVAAMRWSVWRIETVLKYGIGGELPVRSAAFKRRIAWRKPSASHTRCTHLGRLRSISIGDFSNNSVPRDLRPVRSSSGHADTCVDSGTGGQRLAGITSFMPGVMALASPFSVVAFASRIRFHSVSEP